MKILFFGDIVGQPGRQGIQTAILKWQKKYEPDLIVANAENAAHGRGLSKNALEDIFGAGVDVVTLGDHSWDRRETSALLEDKEIPVIRPANYPPGVPGRGFYSVQIRTKKVMVVNLIGRVFMNGQYDDPFRKVDKILDGEKADIVIVDFHAEATAEKKCLGWYLDGRVSAVLGTHTHVPTADERVLPQKTAYISDVGMVGVRDSSLGLNAKTAIQRYLTQMNQRLEVAEGDVEANAVLLEFNGSKIKSIKRLQAVIPIDA